MTQIEKRVSIRRFIMKWHGKGKEHQDDQHDVLSVELPMDRKSLLKMGKQSAYTRRDMNVRNSSARMQDNRNAAI